jgi:hypothetical protein
MRPLTRKELAGELKIGSLLLVDNTDYLFPSYLFRITSRRKGPARIGPTLGVRCLAKRPRLQSTKHQVESESVPTGDLQLIQVSQHQAFDPARCRIAERSDLPMFMDWKVNRYFSRLVKGEPLCTSKER